MKKHALSFLFIITLFSLTAVSASAVVNDTLKVGIRWGSTALEAANLENAVGSGYEFGYYDEDREFVYLDETEETTITMRASGSGNGVTVTETKSGDVLYRFSDNGYCFGVRPIGRNTETWCKGYKYAGGFEYRCNSNGTLTVINVVDLEDYVKGVLPYEMHEQFTEHTKFTPQGSAAVCCNGTFSAFAEAINGAKNLKQKISFGCIMQTAGVLLGFLLAVIFMAFTNYSMFNCFYVLLYNLAWMLITFGIQALKKI